MMKRLLFMLLCAATLASAAAQPYRRNYAAPQLTDEVREIRRA